MTAMCSGIVSGTCLLRNHSAAGEHWVNKTHSAVQFVQLNGVCTVQYSLCNSMECVLCSAVLSNSIDCVLCSAVCAIQWSVFSAVQLCAIKSSVYRTTQCSLV